MGTTADILKDIIDKIKRETRVDHPSGTRLEVELFSHQWEYVIKALEMAVVWEADDETEVESYYD